MLVGRAAELAALDTALTRVRDGHGSVVLIGGEPGAGKTTLAGEAADRARAVGVAVGWGVCPAVGAPAYLPWRSALRDAVPDAADLLAHSQGGGDDARFRMFAAVADALGQAGPTVVVLDDLQWADAGTLQLLHFLMRGLRATPLLVVGTYRDAELDNEHGLVPVLASVPGAGVALHVEGLAVDDVGRLAAALGVRDVSPELLHARTGGNPFLVEQVCTAHASAATGRVPVSAMAMIGQRLVRLSSPCRALLEVAAVAGRQLDLRRLAAALGRDPVSLLPLVDEAVAAGVLTRSEGGHAFRHDLMREAVLDRLSAERATALHWRLGELLATSPAHVDEAARHLQAGVLAGDPQRAVEVTLQAAEQAAASLAFEQAADHLAWAIEEGGGSAELLIRLGEARLGAGDWDGATAAFERASTQARAAGDAEALARAALGFGAGLGGFEVRLLDHRQITLLEEAAAALDGSSSPLRAYVLARLSVALAFVDAPERRAELSRQAVQVAEHAGDAAAHAYALATYADVIGGPDHVQERLELAGRIIDLAGAAGNDELTLLGHRFRVVALLESGRVAELDREIAAFTRVAERYRLPLIRWYVPLFGGMRALMRGDVQEAARLADEAEAVGAQAGSINAPMLATTLRLAICRETGTSPDLPDDARRYIADIMRTEPAMVGPYAAAGSLALLNGDVAEVRRCLHAMARVGFGAHERDAEWLGTLTGAAEMCLALGEVAHAQRVHELLAPYAGLMVVDGIAAACLCAVDEVLASLAGLLGRDDEARSHLHRAAELYERADMPLALARVRALLGADVARAAPVPHVSTGVLRPDGELWLVSYAGREIRVPDAKGLHDLARLLAEPGREVHVAELTGAGTLRGGVDEVLDPRARQAYRQRLRDLDDELEDAERDGDPVRAARARAERDALLDALAEATGLGGRSRTTGSDVERARQAVRSRLRHLLQRLEPVHPELVRHLQASLRTGVTCCYDPEHPVRWETASAVVRRDVTPHR